MSYATRVHCSVDATSPATTDAAGVKVIGVPAAIGPSTALFSVTLGEATLLTVVPGSILVPLTKAPATMPVVPPVAAKTKVVDPGCATSFCVTGKTRVLGTRSEIGSLDSADVMAAY